MLGAVALQRRPLLTTMWSALIPGVTQKTGGLLAVETECMNWVHTVVRVILGLNLGQSVVVAAPEGLLPVGLLGGGLTIC